MIVVVKPKLIFSKRYKNQHGMTLIEIMISLLLGIFLIGGILQLFINTRHTNNFQEELSQIQENGRFAMDSLNREIRQANFVDIACVNYVFPSPPLAGEDNDAVANPTLNGTDTITARWAIATSCGGAPQNRTFSVSTAFTLQLNAVDVVTGVENMQILYGVDSDADNIPNYYAPAGNAAPNVTPALMPQVVSVRIHLLLISADNVTSQPIPFTYMGQVWPSNDRRLRREFTTTIALRNRLP